jgi:hypothetical protein
VDRFFWWMGVWATASFSAAGAWVVVLSIIRRHKSGRDRNVLPTDAHLS